MLTVQDLSILCYNKRYGLKTLSPEDTLDVSSLYYTKKHDHVSNWFSAHIHKLCLYNSLWSCHIWCFS